MHIFEVYETLSNLVMLIVFYWVIGVECEQLTPRRIFYPRYPFTRNRAISVTDCSTYQRRVTRLHALKLSRKLCQNGKKF